MQHKKPSAVRLSHVNMPRIGIVMGKNNLTVKSKRKQGRNGFGFGFESWWRFANV